MTCTIQSVQRVSDSLQDFLHNKRKFHKKMITPKQKSVFLYIGKALP